MHAWAYSRIVPFYLLFLDLRTDCPEIWSHDSRDPRGFIVSNWRSTVSFSRVVTIQNLCTCTSFVLLAFKQTVPRSVFVIRVTLADRYTMGASPVDRSARVRCTTRHTRGSMGLDNGRRSVGRTFFDIDLSGFESPSWIDHSGASKCQIRVL